MIKSVILLLLILSFTLTETTYAKLLPQAKSTTQKAVTKKVQGSSIGVFPKLRKDKKALIVTFQNLQNASAVSYMLTYKQSLRPDGLKTSVQEEGAVGALNLSSNANQTSELLFGTCSKNVCRYHSGIKNAKFEVSYTTKAGKKYLKKYKIKI